MGLAARDEGEEEGSDGTQSQDSGEALGEPPPPVEEPILEPTAGEPGEILGRSTAAVPTTPPGALPPAESMARGTVNAAGDRLAAGDRASARRAALASLKNEGASALAKARARYIAGRIHHEEGQDSQALAFLDKVVESRTPLAAYAAWDAASIDFSARRFSSAIHRCTRYLEEWNDPPFAVQCGLLIGDAYAEWGKADEAVAAFRTFQENHPGEDEGERIALSIARAFEVAGRNARAARAYQNLVDEHAYHTTRVAAEAGLNRLKEKGVTPPPPTDAELFARARTARNCCSWNESQELFDGLLNRYQDQPRSALGKQLMDARRTFWWRNRRFRTLAEDAIQRFQGERDRKVASKELRWVVRAYTKSGDWEEAIRWGKVARSNYHDLPEWEAVNEYLALLEISAGRYIDARSSWLAFGDDVPEKRSDARWFAAYCTYRAGELSRAVQAFTALIAEEASLATAALYFRGRAYALLGQVSNAEGDWNSVLLRSPDGYYGALVKSARRRESGEVKAGFARDGRWPKVAVDGVSLTRPDAPPRLGVPDREDTGVGCWRGSASPLPPRPQSSRFDAEGRPVGEGGSLLASLSGHSALGFLALTAPGPSLARPGQSAPSPSPGSSGTAPPPLTTVASRDPTRRPPAPFPVPALARASGFHDVEEGRALLDVLSDEYWDVWPKMPLARDLAAAGFRTEATTLVASVRNEARELNGNASLKRAARRGRGGGPARPWVAPPSGKADPEPLTGDKRWARISRLGFSSADWRNLSAYLGDANGLVTSLSVSKLAGIPRADPVAGAAWRLAYPPAHAAAVWEHSEAEGVDPLLVLSLMRQESTYNQRARSPVGALGLLQVMPTTGARIASLTHFTPFDRDRLWEPSVNVRFGIWYIGQLLRRFDGAFPLAVASYNGGPHNIGRWLGNKVGMPMDEFVEEIAFPESRNYVKKVVGHYQMYVSIYAPQAYVQLPANTPPDRPEVIDF